MPELRRGATATSATISPSASSWKAPTMCPTMRRSTPCSRASRERYAGGTRSSISSVTARSRKAGRPTRARRSIGRATGGWSQAVLVAWAEPQAKPGSMGIRARPSPGVAIAASVVQIAYFRWRRGKVQTVHWLSLAIIGTFGGATLLLHDETFIKWKPTVLYWLFAAILAIGRVIFRRNLIAALMKDLT